METYSPVVNRFSIRNILTMAAINKWHSKRTHKRPSSMTFTGNFTRVSRPKREIEGLTSYNYSRIFM